MFTTPNRSSTVDDFIAEYRAKSAARSKDAERKRQSISKSRSGERSGISTPPERVLSSTPLSLRTQFARATPTFGLGFSHISPDSETEDVEDAELRLLQRQQRERLQRLHLAAEKEKLLIAAMEDEEKIHQQELALQRREQEAQDAADRRAAEVAEAEEHQLLADIARLEKADDQVLRLQQLRDQKQTLLAQAKAANTPIPSTLPSKAASPVQSVVTSRRSSPIPEIISPATAAAAAARKPTVRPPSPTSLRLNQSSVLQTAPLGHRHLPIRSAIRESMNDVDTSGGLPEDLFAKCIKRLESALKDSQGHLFSGGGNVREYKRWLNAVDEAL